MSAFDLSGHVALITGGNGGIGVGQGNVTLSAANNAVDTLTVSGGRLSTAGNDVTVGSLMTLGDTSFSIDAQHTFAVNGDDLFSEAVARNVILGGGTLAVSNSSITHRYDFESDNGDDSAGVVHGTIEGGATFTNDAMAGSRAIQLDGAPAHG